jgi:hypothetical protein
MTPGFSHHEYKYSPVIVRRFIYTHSWYRRFLARHFQKYKITRQEYDVWYEDMMWKQSVSKNP